MNLYIHIFLCALLVLSPGFSHTHCCKNKEKNWSVGGSVAATNTSSDYTPTNHHQGLSLDHSTLYARGPASKYLDVKGSLAFHTSKNPNTKKVKLDSELEELSLQTTQEIDQNISTKIGKFASYISPGNQESCCSGHFIKRPLLYRGFLGGHLIDNGAHFGYQTESQNSKKTLGFEVFQGKGLMSKTNKTIGLLALMARHQQNLHKNHKISLSLSYLLNTLYNQPIYAANHVGCCQGSSYTGNHMMMSGVEVTSTLTNNIDHDLSLEMARINKLANRFGKNNHHFSHSAGSVTSFKNLQIGTMEAGLRFDYLRGIKFCSCEGAYLNKTIEKTAMIGWKPSDHQTVRLEYTKQTTKNSPQNNIFQTKYTIKF